MSGQAAGQQNPPATVQCKYSFCDGRHCQDCIDASETRIVADDPWKTAPPMGVPGVGEGPI